MRWRDADPRLVGVLPAQRVLPDEQRPPCRRCVVLPGGDAMHAFGRVLAIAGCTPGTTGVHPMPVDALVPDATPYKPPAEPVAYDVWVEEGAADTITAVHAGPTTRCAAGASAGVASAWTGPSAAGTPTRRPRRGPSCRSTAASTTCVPSTPTGLPPAGRARSTGRATSPTGPEHPLRVGGRRSRAGQWAHPVRRGGVLGLPRQHGRPGRPLRHPRTGGGWVCGVRTDDGTIECSGYSTDRMLDPPAGAYTRISAGDEHACASDGSSILCWGDGWYRKTSPPPPR